MRSLYEGIYKSACESSQARKCDWPVQGGCAPLLSSSEIFDALTSLPSRDRARF